MTTNFITSGTRTSLSSTDGVVVTPLLASGTYNVKQDRQTGEYFLEKTTALESTSELTMDAKRRAHKVSHTFHSRGCNTGVLFSGAKGAGKSALVREIAVSLGYPILLINEPLFGTVFNSFMAMITQPVVVIMDEFEKTYHDGHSQDAILTLLDGMFNSNKLFLVTVNDVKSVNNHMINRPGRLYYHFAYDTLTEGVIREYLAREGASSSDIDDIVSFAESFDTFNFDMMKSLYQEMQRYGLTAAEAAQDLNITDEANDNTYYTFEFEREGWQIDLNNASYSNNNPITSMWNCHMSWNRKDGSSEFVSFSLTSKHLINRDGNVFIYRNPLYPDITVKATRYRNHK